MSFKNDIYDEVMRLFLEGTVEKMMPDPSAWSSGTFDHSVKLVHKPSGLEVICSDYESQIENCVAAAIRLRIALDNPED